MTTGPMSQCATCVHLRSPFDVPAATHPDGPFCAAFPTGIGDRVFRNGADHRQPVDGDHGVRWESNGQEFPDWAFAPGVLTA